MSLEAVTKEMKNLETRTKHRTSEPRIGTAGLLSYSSPASEARVTVDRIGSGSNGGVAATSSSWQGENRAHYYRGAREEDDRESSHRDCSSPTRVHLRRTGSIEIEQGGKVLEAPSPSSTPLLLSPSGGGPGGRKSSNGGGGRASGSLGSLATTAATTITATSDEARSALREARWGGATAAATAALDGDRCRNRRRPVVAAGATAARGGVEGGGVMPWSSLSGGGGSGGGSGRSRVGAGAGVDLDARRPAAASKSWRTEADADLSDIKATMRRIDAGAGSGGYATAGFRSPSSSAATANAAAARVDAAPTSATSTAAAARVAASVDLGISSNSRGRRRAPGGNAPASLYSDRVGGKTHGSGGGIGGVGERLYSSFAAGGGGEGAGGGGGERLYSSFAAGGMGRGGEESVAGAAGWGASAGSKAVLSALRALQDKIRKLESERDRASVEAGTLRRQIATLQTENDRATQIQMASIQEKSLASRLAYERLQADKAAQDVRLRKAEEQKRLLAREAAAAKDRSAVAEEARRAAESRVSTLEDRLLALGKEEEKASSAEAEAAEEATRRARGKADQIHALREKVARMEASVSAERTSREEAEHGLERALSAKGKLERFLEGVLRVNEELVKASGASGAGAAPVSKRKKDQQKKKKRPKSSAVASTAAAAAAAAATAAAVGFGANGSGGRGGGVGGGGGNGGGGEDFNVGTHTAKRASARARKIKKANRSSCASCAAAAGAAGAAEPRGQSLSTAAAGGSRHVTFSRVQQQQQQQHKMKNSSSSLGGPNVPTAAGPINRGGASRSTATAAAIGGWTAGGVAGRTVPFVSAGRGAESYNVVSAVSKALKQARSGRPAEPLGKLYTEVGNAVVDSTDEVPSMFRERPRRRPRPRKLKASRVQGGVRGGAVSGGARKSGGRAVLDVAVPDVRSFGPASSPLSGSVRGGVEEEEDDGFDDGEPNDDLDDDLDDQDGSNDGSEEGYDREAERDTSASRERWTREWNRAIGLGGRDGDDDNVGGDGRGRRRRSRHRDAAPAATTATAVPSPRGRRTRDGAGAMDDNAGVGTAAGSARSWGTALAEGGRSRGEPAGARGFHNVGGVGRVRGFAEREGEVGVGESGYGGSSSEGFYESGEERGHADRSGGADEGMGRGGRENDGRGSGDEVEEDNSVQTTTGSEGVGVSGLPLGEGSLSSGDERVWRAAGNY